MVLLIFLEKIKSQFVPTRKVLVEIRLGLWIEMCITAITLISNLSLTTNNNVTLNKLFNFNLPQFSDLYFG